MQSCPQCHLMLEPTLWEGATLGVCRDCGGVWIAGPAFKEIVTGHKERLAELDTLYPSRVSAGLFEGLAQTCPDCRVKQLAAVPVPDCDGREVAGCAACGGVWLPAGTRAELVCPATPPPDPDTSVPPIAEPAPSPPLPGAPSPAVEPPPLVEPAVSGPVDIGADNLNVLAPPDVVIGTPAAQAPPPQPALPMEAVVAAPPARTQPPAGETRAERSLRLLKEGNARFSAERAQRPNQTPERRKQVAGFQSPIAAVVGCVDSRVPPEIVFDQGLGDLFVSRTPGNAVDTAVAAAVEFALEELDVPLVVLLAHTGCGAVQAAMKGTTKQPNLLKVAGVIKPAIEAVRNAPGDPFENAVRENAIQMARALLATAPFLKKQVAAEKVGLAVAMYDLRDGCVQFLEEPEQGWPRVAADLAVREAPLLPAAPAATAAMPAPAAAEAARVCPRCLTHFAEGQSFCAQCGAQLVEANAKRACPGCGTEVHVALDRCPECKADLAAAGAPQRNEPATTVLTAAPWPATPGTPASNGVAQAAPWQSAPAAVPALQPNHAEMWCPDCRRSYTDGSSACVRCAKPLVAGDYRIVCFRCLSENTIAAHACWNCHAPLHPSEMHSSWQDTGELTPPPPRPAYTNQSTGCTSVLVVVAGVFAAIAMLNVLAR